MRECVLAFSRASPGDACPSAGQLLACSLGPIEAKCGPGAGEFVRDYVGRFVNALEPNCSLVGAAINTANLGPSWNFPIHFTHLPFSTTINRCRLVGQQLHGGTNPASPTMCRSIGPTSGPIEWPFPGRLANIVEEFERTGHSLPRGYFPHLFPPPSIHSFILGHSPLQDAP